MEIKSSNCPSLADPKRPGPGWTDAAGLEGDGERAVRPLLYEDVQENGLPHRQCPESGEFIYYTPL